MVASNYPVLAVETPESVSQDSDFTMANFISFEPPNPEEAQHPSHLPSHDADAFPGRHPRLTSVAALLETTSSQPFLPQESVCLLDELNSRLCLPGLAGDRALMGCAMYFLSNHHLSGRQLSDFVSFMMKKPLQQLRQCLPSIPSEFLHRFLDSVLIRAAMDDRVELLDLLWDYGYDLKRHVRGIFSWQITTAMHEALTYWNVGFCKRLIELGVNLTTTPLPCDIEEDMDPDATYLSEGKMPYETSTIFLAAKDLPDLVRSELPNLVPSLAENLLPVAVQAGMDVTGVSKLISEGADINGIDDKLWTALHYAISREDVFLTEYLLDNGASPDGWGRTRRTGFVPLHAELELGDEWESSFLLTPLMLAVQIDNSELCHMLIKAQADINLSIQKRLLTFLFDDTGAPHRSFFWADGFHFDRVLVEGFVTCTEEIEWFTGRKPHHFDIQTAVEIAAAHGSTKTLKMLLQYGADLSINYTTSPLALAVGFGEVQDVQLLLDYGACPHAVADGDLELSALQVACLRGHAEIASELIEAGANVDDPVMDGPTPLQCAAAQGNVKIVRGLLELGADPDAAPDEHHGLTALQGAIYYGRSEVVDCLLEYGVNIDAPAGQKVAYTALGTAITSHRPDIFNRLINAGTGDHSIEWDGVENREILLSMAEKASRNDYLLLFQGAKLDFDQRLENGLTFAEDEFLRAAIQGRTAHMKTLLSKTTNFGQDVLTQAVNSMSPTSKEEWDVVMILLDRGAKVCRQGNLAPLIFHAEDLDIMETLVAKGADVNEPWPSSCGNTILQDAVERQHIAMIKFLLGKGANINAPAARHLGRTALQMASEKGNVRILKLLLDHGADVNAPAGWECGATALQAASIKGYIGVAEILIRAGADINAPAGWERGVTALQAASIKGYIGIAEILIRAGADIGAPPSPKHGRTALNGAAEHGRLSMVKLLLDNYRLKDGESLSQLCDDAAKHARRECHWGVVELLEKYQRPANSSP
ncbi:hypothetical protein RBB50_001048 [Rhinocladiella similis]